MELSLCREIVRQNRGQISISGSGNKTTFHIAFIAEGM
jgi:signal transduction histidine kinase